ncbi:MAG: hypothetical protein E5V75_35565, partial [Mesorhizobium sp.]
SLGAPPGIPGTPGAPFGGEPGGWPGMPGRPGERGPALAWREADTILPDRSNPTARNARTAVVDFESSPWSSTEIPRPDSSRRPRRRRKVS